MVAPVHYKFEWAVKDDYSSVDMGQFEGHEGRHTKGFYYVLLPDGRRQIVDYYVDGDSGFVADVRYVGSGAKYDNNDFKEQLIVEEIPLYGTHQHQPIYESEIKPIYKEEIKPFYNEEILKPIYKEETVPLYKEEIKQIYNEELKPTYNEEIVRPVYKEDINPVYDDYKEEIRPVYKEAILSSYQPEVLKPFYKEETVPHFYKEEIKPIYEAEILKPVYKEEIKAAYGGEREDVYLHRPGKSVFEPEFTPQHVIEFIKPEYRRQF